MQFQMLFCIVGYYGIVAVKDTVPHIYNIYFCLKVVIQSGWQLYNSRECGMLAWPCCVWLVACGGLSARMRSASARATAQAMVAHSRSSGSWPEMCGQYGPGSMASSSSLIRCRVDFWRQATLSPSWCIGAASLSWSVSDCLLPSTDDLGFGTVLLLFRFLMFSPPCYWFIGGFGGRGYSSDYAWLSCRDAKRCLVCSREQGLELLRKRDRRERECCCAA
jgi:hypothetical protein